MLNVLTRIALAVAATAVTSVAVQAEIALPSRKAGYWEIHMVHETGMGPPDMLIHACIDAETDKAMMDAGLSMTKDMCSKSEIKQAGDGYVWDSECTIGPMKTNSHVEVSGDFQAAYTMKITGDVSGMSKEPMKSSMTQTAKWLAAACPDGVKPGDMQMPGGITINANNFLQGMGAMKNKTAPAP